MLLIMRMKSRPTAEEEAERMAGIYMRERERSCEEEPHRHGVTQ